MTTVQLGCPIPTMQFEGAVIQRTHPLIMSKPKRPHPKTTVPKGPSVVTAPSANPPLTKLLAPNARDDLLKAIEQARSSRVLTYVTAARPDVGAKMALDTIPVFQEHLDAIGHQERLDLFLYTRGGHTVAAPRVAYLMREYCDHLAILVPRFAHSAGTSLALAADEIVMHPMGELGPIDPSVANQFNPADATDATGQTKIPISVEDVSGFLAMVRDLARVPPERVAETVTVLAEHIHPLSLGNVYRQYLLIRTMGKRLLETHLDPVQDEDRISHIMDMLTEKFYYHEYPISRWEARENVRLPVAEPDRKLETMLWDLYNAYDSAMALGEAVVAPASTSGVSQVQIDSAAIESLGRLHVSRVSGALTTTTRSGQPPNVDLAIGGSWKRLV